MTVRSATLRGVLRAGLGSLVVGSLSLVFACGSAGDPNGSVSTAEAISTSTAQCGHDRGDEAEQCPRAVCEMAFDLTDPVEAQLSAIGCTSKSFIPPKTADGRIFFSAFCPRNDANEDLVAKYRNVHPYDMVIADHACATLPRHTVVDVWDPVSCPSCLQAPAGCHR